MKPDNRSPFNYYDDDPLRAMPGVLNEALFECLNLMAGWFTRKEKPAPEISEQVEADASANRFPASQPWTFPRWQRGGIKRW
jgi:hypothetical protein